MSNVIRIAVFYDGNYLSHVSNYYKFKHPRRARIDLSGLHRFIQHRVSGFEQVDQRLCQIVEAHYFRGRFGVSNMEEKEAEQPGFVEKALRNDRTFDDVLMRANITTHFCRMNTSPSLPQPKETGVDVWLALEAYDLAVHKKFDVLALVACDGDYVPLVRKLNSIGTRVMLLAWDLEADGKTTRTSQALINECSYPITMHEEINNRANRGDTGIDNLFVRQTPRLASPPPSGSTFP